MLGANTFGSAYLGQIWSGGVTSSFGRVITGDILFGDNGDILQMESGRIEQPVTGDIEEGA